MEPREPSNILRSPHTLVTAPENPSSPCLPHPPQFLEETAQLIIISHPAWPDGQDIFLILLALDDITGGSAHYGAVWLAAAIIAGNAFNGFLSRSKDPSATPITHSPDDILEHGIGFTFQCHKGIIQLNHLTSTQFAASFRTGGIRTAASQAGGLTLMCSKIPNSKVDRQPLITSTAPMGFAEYQDIQPELKPPIYVLSPKKSGSQKIRCFNISIMA